MSLPSALEPYSTWIFSNRNVVIVLMGLVLIGVGAYALIMNWRVESLKRDLIETPDRPERQVYSPGRASAPQHETEPSAPGGLPPVRGGRTYARNLGSALQKSGVPPSPPIYSPPTPPGWAPNAPPAQAGRPPGPAFPGGPAPWSAPPPQPPMSWPPAATPALQGTPQMAPGPMPPTSWPPFPGQPAPAVGPLAPQPNSIPAPPATPPFAAPVFSFAPPGAPAPPANPPVAAPGGPPSFPTFAPPAPPPMPVEEVDKRGKPKRRRFGLSMFEGLEKKIQSLPAAFPKVIAPESPAPPLAQAPAMPPPVGTAAPPASVPASPIVPPAFPSIPAPAAAAPPVPPATSAPVIAPAPMFAPALAEPLQAPPARTTPPVLTTPVPAIEQEDHAATAEPTDAEEPPAAPAGEPETEAPSWSEAPSRPKSARERRAAMRAMMFGEEPPPAPATEPAPAASASTSAFGRYEPPAPVEPPAAEAPSAEPAAEEPLFTFTPPAADLTPAAEPEWEVAEPVASTETPPAVESARFGRETEPDVIAAESAPDETSSAPEHETSEEPVGASEAHVLTDHETFSVEAPVAEPEAALHAGFAETGAGPAFPSETDEAIPPAPEPIPADGKPSAGTMVIIEDDAAVADYYATLFRGNGYRVEIAHDGVSGVDVCSKVQPDVIMLDVMMPRQNGILVLQTLRASDETKNTPVVVLSNFSEPTLIKRALQLGALEYVIKTQVEGSALLQAVPRWMNREKAFAA